MGVLTTAVCIWEKTLNCVWTFGWFAGTAIACRRSSGGMLEGDGEFEAVRESGSEPGDRLTDGRYGTDGRQEPCRSNDETYLPLLIIPSLH